MSTDSKSDPGVKQTLDEFCDYQLREMADDFRLIENSRSLHGVITWARDTIDTLRRQLTIERCASDTGNAYRLALAELLDAPTMAEWEAIYLAIRTALKGKP